MVMNWFFRSESKIRQNLRRKKKITVYDLTPSVSRGRSTKHTSKFLGIVLNNMTIKKDGWIWWTLGEIRSIMEMKNNFYCAKHVFTTRILFKNICHHCLFLLNNDLNNIVIIYLKTRCSLNEVSKSRNMTHVFYWVTPCTSPWTCDYWTAPGTCCCS